MAEREGFEPSVPFWGTHAFQACTFNHSDISPYWGNYRGLTGNMSKTPGMAAFADNVVMQAKAGLPRAQAVHIIRSAPAERGTDGVNITFSRRFFR